MGRHHNQFLVGFYSSSIIFLSSIAGLALAQDPPPEASSAEKKSESNSEGALAPAKSLETPSPAANGARENVGAIVDSQKGCRLVIRGLPAKKVKSQIVLLNSEGSRVNASITSSSNNKTTATLTGDACKQNVKGWRAEVAVDPNSAPIQVGEPIIFEPESSGWHRAKRPGAFYLGLGAGFQIPAAPMYGIQLGWSDPRVSFGWTTDIGASTGGGFKISGSSAFNITLFTGNSWFYDVGFGNESRSAVFTPKRIINGEIKESGIASGTSKISFIHYGFGNKWQWGGFGIAVEWLGFRGTISRTDEVDISDVVITTLQDGTVVSETKSITDEGSVSLSKEILRKKVGEGGTYRLMFTSFSYSF